MITTNIDNTKYTFNTSFADVALEDISNAQGPTRFHYHDRPRGEYTFFGCNGDPSTKVTLGVELETSGYEGISSDQMARYLHSKYLDRIHCERDGSIQFGAEIISEPATLQYHMRKFGWADILHAIGKAGGKGHDAPDACCGLHVHVGRTGLGNTDDARDLCTAKLMILMDRWHERELYAFSRRRTLSEMSDWAKKVCANILPTDRRDVVVSKSRGASCNRDRYCALNLTNSATIEFRIFRSTLNPESFAATLQLVDTLVKYCKTHTLQQVVSCTFGDVVATCKYPELARYCSRRGINLERSEGVAA